MTKRLIAALILLYANQLFGQSAIPNYKTLSLQATTYSILVDADTVSVTAAAGGTVAVEGTGTFTLHQVEIPPGALTGDEAVIARAPTDDDIPADQWQSVPSAVTFEVEGHAGYDFADSVTMTVEFLTTEVSDVRERMRIHVWDTAISAWKRLMSAQDVSAGTNIITAKTDHFSTFGAIEVPYSLNEKAFVVGWNMVGIPVEMEGAVDPESLFNDDVNPFVFSSDNSSMYEYDEAAGQWVRPETVEMGRGYIVYGFYPCNVDIGGLEVTGDFTRNLTKTGIEGWNLAGNPYLESIDWGTDVLPGAGVTNRYYRWTGSQYEYYPGGGLTATIEPWQGFWVYTSIDGADLEFVYPGSGAPKRTVFTMPDIAWRMQISAESGTLKDTYNFIGRSEHASYDYDECDVFELTPLGDEFISLYFIRENSKHTEDIIPLDGDAQWRMSVATNSPGSTTLRWNIPDGLDTRHTLMLQQDEKSPVNMRTQNEYTFYTGSSSPRTAGLSLPHNNGPPDVMQKFSSENTTVSHFTITLKESGEQDGEIAPDRYYLQQNYPNPFNTATTIVYGLAKAGKVTLKIYNMLGQEVRTLVHADREAGVYRESWDGLNNSGYSVASGLYFYRITSRNYSCMKKMVLLK